MLDLGNTSVIKYYLARLKSKTLCYSSIPKNA